MLLTVNTTRGDHDNAVNRDGLGDRQAEGRVLSGADVCAQAHVDNDALDGGGRNAGEGGRR